MIPLGAVLAPCFTFFGLAFAAVVVLAAQCRLLAVVLRRDVSFRVFARPSVRALVGRLLRFGVPAGGYEVLNMLSFTIFVFVTGQVGGEAFAVSNACFTVNYLLFAPMTGFALGAQTLVGQARGRGGRHPFGGAQGRGRHEVRDGMDASQCVRPVVVARLPRAPSSQHHAGPVGHDDRLCRRHQRRFGR